MEFTIKSSNPQNIIKANNSLEKEMLKTPLFKTKISYREVEEIKNVQGEIIEGNKFSIDNKENLSIKIPSLMMDGRRASYYIRMVLDANAVKNNCLPLHAAALKDRWITYFIFGETRKGKSFTLDKILSNNPHIKPIGDDHIIIGGGLVSGNKVMRTRYGVKESYSTFQGDQIFSLEKYNIILIDVTKKDESPKILEEDITKDFRVQKAVLKYLMGGLQESGSERIHKEIASKEIKIKYLDDFRKFVRGAGKITKLSGGKDYVWREIRK